MSQPIRVLLADDHPIFIRGLRHVLEADPRVEVAGEAQEGESALQLIRNRKCEVAVLDLEMPGKDGVEILKAIRDEKLPIAVIFLTMHKSEAMFNKAIDSGADGYVLKDAAFSEILDAIKAVAAGRNFVSPALSTYLFGRRRRSQAMGQQQPGLDDLTPTERRVLQSIAAEKSSAEIARQLFISVRTVDRHRANICAKLDLHGNNALLRFALAHKSELS